MPLFTRFPFLEGIVDASVAGRLEQRFVETCSQAGIALDAPEAEAIGINLIADYASGWSATSTQAEADNA